MIDIDDEVDRFIRGELDAATFSHGDHVRMAFELLRRLDFDEAAFRFSSALRAMTRKAGKPQVFHQTITIAFLALISERLGAAGYADFEAFGRRNSDLFDKSILSQWYSPEQLATDAARRSFLLPGTCRS